MKIQQMFRDDINRQINGVVQVEQDTERVLIQELEEYVVTKELKKHFITLFNNYGDAFDQKTNDVGVWISGFFGSGKSHFLKILSYILANKEVQGVKTVERFRSKFEDDPATFMLIDKATKGETDTILFNIDIEGSINKDATAVLRVFAKMFYNYLGFYGEDLKVAKLEQFIDKQGKTEEFRKVFEEKNGDSWVNTRESFVFFEDDVVASLQEVLGMSEEAARNWFNGTETVETSIAQLVSEIKDYVDKKPDNFRLLFMIDEVGQYVGENTDHLLNLQSLIEEIGSKCEGKVWVMCTGQEALDEIIKTRQDEFSRIQARFKTRLSLSSTSADEVIQKRLLSKTDEAEEELEEVYNANDSVLRNLLKFNKDDALLDVRGFETPQEFARDFPFVPYQFLLLQKVYTAIRKHGNAGKHQSSGERSMLSGFQEAAKSVQDKDEYALVPFYKFYDTVKTSLDGAINRVIDRCQTAADEDRGIKQQDVDVLKLLYLIRYVDTDVKSTLDSIVILMADNINMDKIQMRAQVQESLDRLLNQNYIGRNGNTYNFLTDEEQDIARDIKDTPVDTAQIIERIGHLVFGDIYDKKKYRYGIYDFPYDQYVDGTAIGSVTGGMKLQVYSIATDDYEKQDLRLQTNSKGQAIVVLGDGKYYECIESALKIRKYVKTRNIAQLPKSVQDIIRTQQDEATKYENDALDYIKRAIESAEFYVDGEHIEIKGGDAKSKLDQSLEYLVTHVYYDLDLIGQNVNDDSDIIAILTGQAPTIPGTNPNSGAAQKIEGYLDMQDMKHITTKMSDIQARYQGIPSGWREIDIAAVVALLIYEQKVTIKYGGMTIQPTDPKLPDMLRKKTEIGKTEITKRHVVSPTKMKEARDFLRDFFDVMDVPTDEDGLIAFIIEKFTELENHYNGLSDKYENNKYPDKQVVRDAVRVVKDVLSQKSDNIALIDKVVASEDTLYDMQDHMKNVESFFKTQVSIFDNAVSFVQSMNNDLDYISRDDEATHALNQMRLITTIFADKSYDYKRIPELNSLQATVEKSHDVMLDEKREALYEIVRSCMEDIHKDANVNEETKLISSKADQFFSQQKAAIAAEKSLKILDGLSVLLWGRRDDDTMAIEAAKAPKSDPKPSVKTESAQNPPKKEIIKKVARQQMFPAKVLKSDEEIDAYVDNIRKQMKQYLQGSDGIQITN
ncbi:BREX system P-loop protein BrxC [Butyrivibrio sp. AE2015]|uniref:BREX system P-loop protein BrxC n=1 Tax=Butyrivibrio sp. AE2015 TaxID=1280663 RepID=UPI0003B57055|nr:BREX system P-loop protein BrxC [Butyrivibrio sp. AE2015]